MKLSLGVGLIEFLVAQCVFLSIMASVFYLYHSLDQSYRHLQKAAQQHENARIAFQIMESEIREAGFIGCPRFSSTFPLRNYSKFPFAPENILQGTSHEITVKKARAPFRTIKHAHGKVLWLEVDPAWKAGETLIISDCAKSEIHTIEKVSASHGEHFVMLNTPMNFSFESGACVAPMQSEQFYLSKNKSTQGLFVKELSHSQDTSEIVDNVKNFEIRYGVFDGARLKFLTSTEIQDWQKVFAVQLILTLISDDSIVQSIWEDVIWLRERPHAAMR